MRQVGNTVDGMRTDSWIDSFISGTALLGWGVRAIGPSVGRVLVAQLVVILLSYGLATRLIDPILQAMLIDGRLRAVLLAVLAIVSLIAASRTRALLFPDALSCLRRQPVGALAMTLLTLPWAALLTWPLVVIVALGQVPTPVVLLAALIGAVGILGIAAAQTFRVRVVRALFVGLLLIALDHFVWIALPMALLAVTFDVRRLGADIRQSLVRQSMTRADRSRYQDWRSQLSPFEALVRLDLHALRTHPAWLVTAWLPLLTTAFLIVISPLGNGNCAQQCLASGAFFIIASATGLAVAALTALRDVQGVRLLVPDRVVSTRCRLGSLAGITMAPLMPFIAVMIGLSGEISVLPFALAIVLIILLRQLSDPTRGIEIGPVLWWLIPLLSLVPLPAALRLAAIVLSVGLLAWLVDRRGRSLRHELAAGRWRPVAGRRP